MSTKAVKQLSMLVADEAWIGLALLLRENPSRESFTAREILDRVKAERILPELRPGVQVHIYLHNVANLPPKPATYRMFYRLPDDTYRLFRPGDRAHPLRRGKITPARHDLPEGYRYLLDWYEQEYASKETVLKEEDDPILQMKGAGKDLWAGTNADEYVRSLRTNWYGDRNPEK